MARRMIKANTRVAVALVADPDPFAIQAASLGVMTNPFSPASAGIHSPGASPRGFVGDRGFGVNRWAGRTTYPLQHWAGAIKPVSDPSAQRLGLGAGVAGQPGLPSTGGLTGGLSSLAWMSWSPLGRAGLGG
jgi:hypothetical protein